MRPLRRLLDRIAPYVEPDAGVLRQLHPLYDALDTFLFDPNELTTTAPHVRDAMNLKRYMILVVVCLGPPTMMAVYHGGLRALAIILTSYAVGGAIESVFAVARREPINEGFLVTGMLFPLTLPVTTPLWQVGLGIAFGVVFGKEVFGGTGHNLFNPALVARCFLLLAYPVDISPDKWVAPAAGPTGQVMHYFYAGVHEGRRAIFDLFDGSALPHAVDAISGATPLGAAAVGGWPAVQEQFTTLQMFLGQIPGSLGETSALACLLGGLLLCGMKIANWRVPFSMLGTVAAMSAVLYYWVNPLLGADVAPAALFEPPVFHLFAGGMMLGAFFMATDPVSSPTTDRARYLYGIVIGIGAVLIRELTGYPEGVMFAILLGNLCAPTLDEFMYGRVRRMEAALVSR